MTKKHFYLSVLLLIVLLFGGSCSGSTSSNAIPTDIVNAVLANLQEAPTGITYYSTAVEYSENHLSEWVIGNMYANGYGEEVSEFSLLEDYAIFLPTGPYAFEINVFKVKNTSDVSTIEKICENRLNLLKNNNDIKLYDAEADTIFKNAEVYTIGKYVFLLCTPDNATAKQAIKDIL